MRDGDIANKSVDEHFDDGDGRELMLSLVAPKNPPPPPEAEVLVLAEMGGGLINDAGDPIGE